MKSITLCLVVLLAAVVTLHNVACQEETTTTLVPAADESAKDKPQETTEVPTPVESAPSESTSPDSAKPDTTETTTNVTEEKSKEGEEKKDEAITETPEPKDEAKEEETKVDIEGERQPKEESGEEEVGPRMPQQPPKFIFVTQHVRDPVTGVVYTRQVPLIPTSYLRPLPNQPDLRRGQPMPPMQPMQPQPEKPQEPSAFDPLGQYTDQQKKRQFYQDMLLTQLARFEKEIEPMSERVENVTEKNDIEELLGSVAELKQKLEIHQIFNITELMKNWKEGRLAEGQQGEQGLNEQPRQPQMPMIPQGYGRPQRPSGPPVTLRTLILVPRMNPQQQQPQPQPQYNPYPQMTRQIPVIHIRRTPYQPSMYESEGQQQQPGKQFEQMEPQPAGSEEYANNNEIFGY